MLADGTAGPLRYLATGCKFYLGSNIMSSRAMSMCFRHFRELSKWNSVLQGTASISLKGEGRKTDTGYTPIISNSYLLGMAFLLPLKFISKVAASKYADIIAYLGAPGTQLHQATGMTELEYVSLMAGFYGKLKLVGS